MPTAELSSVSLGSHEVVFNRILGRGPDIGQPRIILSTNQMQIFNETVVRSMPPDLSPYQRYARLAREVRQKLKEQPGLKLILQTDGSSLTDARSLKRYLIRKGIVSSQNIGIARVNSTGNIRLDGFESGQQNRSQKKPSCSISRLTINLAIPGKVRHVKEWQLVIKNNSQETVRIYKGNDRLPDQLIWDWRNDWGELVAPGEYSCNLSVKSLNGTEKSSTSSAIRINRVNRTVYLRFSTEPELQASNIKL